MIDVKQAVKSAAAYLQLLYDGQELTDLRLEEVEKTPDGNNWLITFGFNQQDTPANPFQALADRRYRVYKVIEVDGDSGEAIAMRMRAEIL